MKAGKAILVIVVLVLVSAGVGTWLLFNNLDRVAGEAIVETGEELLETRVSLDSVEITIMEGKAALRGLEIANPAGYSSDPAITLDLIEIDIDLKSINDEVLVIEKILVREPRINYEMDESGDSNIAALQASIEEAGPSSGGSDDLLIIDRLDFEGGQITATAALKPDEQLAFDFPSLSMNGIGRPDGASADAIGAEITSVLMDRVISAASRAGVESLLESQKEKLVEKAEEKIKDKLGDLLKRD